jgi:hypothetical protein
MTKHYRDYCWQDGSPLGLQEVDLSSQGECYKIVSDPYHKRISVEKYAQGQFTRVVYDSIFLDFRHLRKPEQTAWQKIPVSEEPHRTLCLIRNQDDRVLYRETHYFEGSLCRSCRVESPQGILLSTHSMSYTHLGDPFDGVTLFDAEGKVVLVKRYEYDAEALQFTTLLTEDWKPKEAVH